MHRADDHGPALNLVLVVDDEHVPPELVRQHRGIRQKCRLKLPQHRLKPDKRTRQNRSIRVVKDGLDLHRAGLGVDRVVAAAELTLVGKAGLVDEPQANLEVRSPVLARPLVVVASAQIHDGALVHLVGRVDLRIVDHRRQQGRVDRAHQHPRVDRDHSDAPIDRAFDLRVVEVELRGGEFRLGQLHLGLGGGFVGLGLVQFLLGPGPLRDDQFHPVQRDFREPQIRLHGLEFGLGLLHRSYEGAWVNREQQFARFDSPASVHVASQKKALHPGPHFDRLNPTNPPGVFERVGNGRDDRARHRDVGGRRGSKDPFLGLAASGRQQECRSESRRSQWDCRGRSADGCGHCKSPMLSCTPND